MSIKPKNWLWILGSTRWETTHPQDWQDHSGESEPLQVRWGPHHRVYNMICPHKHPSQKAQWRLISPAPFTEIQDAPTIIQNILHLYCGQYIVRDHQDLGWSNHKGFESPKRWPELLRWKRHYCSHRTRKRGSSMKAHKVCFKRSYFPQAIQILNKDPARVPAILCLWHLLTITSTLTLHSFNICIEINSSYLHSLHFVVHIWFAIFVLFFLIKYALLMSISRRCTWERCLHCDCISSTRHIVFQVCKLASMLIRSSFNGSYGYIVFVFESCLFKSWLTLMSTVSTFLVCTKYMIGYLIFWIFHCVMHRTGGGNKAFHCTLYVQSLANL